jgi:cell division protein FtsB
LLPPKRPVTTRKRRSAAKANPLWRLWAVAVVVLLFWNLAGPFGIWKLHNLKRERERVYSEYIRVLKENETLKEYAAAFQEDPAFQERVVRKELNWVRDNELLYRFVR